jgi:hypothetical protein
LTARPNIPNEHIVVRREAIEGKASDTRRCIWRHGHTCDISRHSAHLITLDEVREAGAVIAITARIFVAPLGDLLAGT